MSEENAIVLREVIITLNDDGSLFRIGFYYKNSGGAILDVRLKNRKVVAISVICNELLKDFRKMNPAKKYMKKNGVLVPTIDDLETFPLRIKVNDDTELEVKGLNNLRKIKNLHGTIMKTLTEILE